MKSRTYLIYCLFPSSFKNYFRISWPKKSYSICIFQKIVSSLTASTFKQFMAKHFSYSLACSSITYKGCRYFSLSEITFCSGNNNRPYLEADGGGVISILASLIPLHNSFENCSHKSHKQ